MVFKCMNGTLNTVKRKEKLLRHESVKTKDDQRRLHIMTYTTTLETYEQLNQIRDLLAPHGAYLANYIDTWTVTELLK